jgi:hypothetical protein
MICTRCASLAAIGRNLAEPRALASVHSERRIASRAAQECLYFL